MQWTRADSRMLLSTAALDWRYPSTHPCSVVLSHIQSWREAPQGLRVLIFYTMGENSRIKSENGKMLCNIPSHKSQSVKQFAILFPGLSKHSPWGSQSIWVFCPTRQETAFTKATPGHPCERVVYLAGQKTWLENLGARGPGFDIPALVYFKKHKKKKTTKCNQQQTQPLGDFKLKSIIG